MASAEKKTGVCRASIIRSLKKAIKTQSKANPYIWVYKKDYPDVPLQIDPTDWKPKPRVRTVSKKFLEEKAKLKTVDGTALSAPKAVIQYNKDYKVISEYYSIAEAVRRTGISANTITTYCSGKNDNKLKDPKFLKKIKYIWKFKE